MSRVGKVPIKLAQGVKIVMDGRILKVEGPKGKLSHPLADGVTAKVDKETLTIGLDEVMPDRSPKGIHGVTRTVVANMVKGVSTGFVRELDIVGVGFRAAMKGNVLTMNIGFSHQIDFKLPDGVQGKVDNNTHITLTGADKQIVGMTAAKIRAFRPPEPYQGKGIRYTNEHIIRKEGKAAGTAGAK